VRRLIINADDLGLTAGVNRGILRAHAAGVVTSATLMANGAAFQDAVQQLGATPGLGLGCHLVLMDGAPLLPPPQVSSLLANGGFHQDFLSFARRALRGRFCPEEIEAEATAQMRKIQSAGLALTHFDTHKHAHMFSSVLRPLLRAARACGIGGVRNPFAPLKPMAFAHLARRPRLWTRYSEVRVLRALGSAFRRQVSDAGLATTDGTFGIVTTGTLDETLFRAILGCIPEGTWEMVCHPGYCDAELAAVRTRLRESRQRELEILTSPLARDMVREHGIELISYRDLAAHSSRAEVSKE
jgi:hopanoid biosynthesis associated protein HpnK